MAKSTPFAALFGLLCLLPAGCATAPEPLSDMSAATSAPQRKIEILKQAPLDRPYVTVTGYCENTGYVLWDEHLTLAEVEVAAKFHKPPSVPFVVVQIYRPPQQGCIFEDMRIGRGGRVTEPSHPAPSLLPGDRIVATEMVF